MDLKNTAFEIWNNNLDRQLVDHKFKSIFRRFIGVQDSSEYSNILATYLDKINEYTNQSIGFDQTIPLQMTSELFTLQGALTDELKNISSSRLLDDKIMILFTDDNINTLWLKSLQDIVTLAIKYENFPNKSVQNNFIIKMVTYSYLYLKDLTFSDIMNNKCVYYGDITRHDYYFLILLHFMSFDVIYINPEHDICFDFDTFSDKHIEGTNTLKIETFEYYASKGVPIDQINSIFIHYNQQVETVLFNEESGTFKPWQFKKGTTKSVFYNATLIDLKNYWSEQAKMRTGFSISSNIVTIPHFFFEIEGVLNNMTEYQDLLSGLINTKNTMFMTTDKLHDIPIPPHSEILKLVFLKNQSDFKYELFNTVSFYRYEKFNDDTEKFINSKINEFIKQPIIQQLSENEQLEIVALLLSLPEEYIQAIDNFDFPHDVPKIVIYCQPDYPISKQYSYILGYLSLIGFDIAIISPNGQSNLSSYIPCSQFSSVRLDKIDYHLEYKDVLKMKHKKSGFFEFFRLK